MKKKSNPTTVASAKVTYFGKGGFVSASKAKKVSIRLPWMKKARTFEVEVKGRLSKKKVNEFVLSQIHKLEVERNRRLSKTQQRRARELPFAKKYEPWEVKAKYTEETFYSKTLQSFIQSNKMRYTYTKKHEFNEKNYMQILKPLFQVVKSAAIDFFFEQNAYGDYLQIKLDFIGSYLNTRRSNKTENMSFGSARMIVNDPSNINDYVLGLFKDFVEQLSDRTMSDNYFRIKMVTETYSLLGFTIERVSKVSV